MRYFLGVDIGGSKSHALIADEHGQAIGFGSGGPGNYEVVGWQGLRERLHEITRRALANAGLHRNQIAGAGFGIAGYDWPGERAPTQEAVDSLELDAPCALVNDTVIGLVAGAEEGWGVVVIAGTSNNCRGRDRQGREGQMTGCGPEFAEYGGAQEIVRRAVQAVALAWTRRGPETRLTRLFQDEIGAGDTAGLLEGLALGHYRLTAAHAPLVFEAAAQGDEVAQDIVRWAGRELGSLARGVIHQLGIEDLEFEVILAGSLYDGSPTLAETMQSTICEIAPGARLVRLASPPVVGAVLLGMEQTGVSTYSLRRTLIESTRRLLR